MQRKKLYYLTSAGMIAALYVLLTWLSSILGLSSGALQLRFSEVLCVLPYFTPAAVPGLFAGCFVANLLTPLTPWDLVFGSFATLLSAVIARFLRRYKWLVPWPNVLLNTAIIPFVILLSAGTPITFSVWLVTAATVGGGELIVCVLLGYPLMHLLAKYRQNLFIE